MIMRTMSYELGSTPAITIRVCYGDLEIIGRAESVTELRSDELPRSHQEEDRLVIEECCDDVKLKVPPGARVDIDQAYGDVRADKLAELRIGTVHSDLHVSEIVGMCELGTVAGDAVIREVGSLSLISVSGDLNVERTVGTLALGGVDGDVALRGTLAGTGGGRVGGDLLMQARFQPGAVYELEVEGDASIALPAETDVSLIAQVAGDVSGLKGYDSQGGYAVTWGSGASRLTLKVEGDLVVRAAGRPVLGEVAVPISVPGPASPPPLPTFSPQMRENMSARETVEQPVQPLQPAAPDSELALLEAVARGEISPEEADRLLGAH